jgi:hypothetical protein
MSAFQGICFVVDSMLTLSQQADQIGNKRQTWPPEYRNRHSSVVRTWPPVHLPPATHIIGLHTKILKLQLQRNDDKSMDYHALTLLEEAESWHWPVAYHIQESGEQGGKHRALTAKLLACCIRESRAYPNSTLVDQFWGTVQRCNRGLRTNSKGLFVWLDNCA